jgi:hypothetical protein
MIDMKITGVTIIKNAIKNDYPIVEAVNSILPMVDEMIVSIDNGEDDTEHLIKNIKSDKIKIVYSTWDMNLREGGKVYAVETDKVISHVSPDTDWIFYIQADEVIHEKYYPAILAAAKKYASNDRVQGLLLNYLHFYATYDYVGDSRKWYNYEVRLIKNDKRIKSYKDAQGFRMGKKKLDVVLIDAEVYHYGWVKSPQQMKRKQKEIYRYYTSDDTSLAAFVNGADLHDFNEFDSLRKFTDTHPSVMNKRIKEKNWNVELDITKKRMKSKDRILYYVEKLTGARLFTFKNYRVIR